MMRTELIARLFDRAVFARAADVLALLVAVSLPWSTSATSILIALWALALLPTLDLAALRRVLTTPAGGLPPTLWALALVGLLWAEGPWSERFSGFTAFFRLLAIPLLLIQFERSEHAMRVAAGFLAGSTALLLLSWVQRFWPGLWWHVVTPGVPVKDYVVQSGEFLLCAFALAHWALDAWQARRRLLAAALALIALAFLANIIFVATARSTLIVLVVLIIAFGLQRCGWRGSVAIGVGTIAIAAIAWFSSPYLRARVLAVAEEIKEYRTEHIGTSTGYRIEFWTKSLEFIATAPVFGHGTGSIRELFREVAVGTEGPAAATPDNPHNQTLSIALQLGLVGVVLLYAMWVAHLLLFGGGGLPAWVGFGVVMQNIVMSLFNSQIFYFAPGWLYVFGVGVLGGMMLRKVSDRAE